MYYVQNFQVCSNKHIMNSAKHMHNEKIIQICHNTPKVCECFVKQNWKTEDRETATDGALSFHAVNIT
jgi:hypothetical protein